MSELNKQQENELSKAYLEGSKRFQELGDNRYDNPYQPSTDKESFLDFSRGWQDTKNLENGEKPLSALTDSEIGQQKNEANVKSVMHHEQKATNEPIRETLESTGFIKPSKEEVELEKKTNALQKESLKRSKESDQERENRFNNSHGTVVTKKFDAEVDNAVKKRNNLSNEDQNSVESQEVTDEINLKAIPKNINNDYNEINNKYFLKNDPDTLAFVDKGHKIQAKLSNVSIAKSLVSIAEERNWTELKVTGTKEFKHHVWLEASQRGITVKGYKPSEADLAELKQKTANKFNEIANEETNIKDSNLIDDDKFSGKLVDHGKAPYQNKPDNNTSYFAIIKKDNGQKNTAWGVDIERAIKENEIKLGDTIQLENKGREAVTITQKVRDEKGNITGRKTIETHRNTWDIKANAIKDKSQEPEDIVKEHPDLVNEVAAIKIAEKFSQTKFSNETDRDRFVTEVRNNLAVDLEKGQQNIDVKRNEQQVVEQEKEEESHEL